MKLYKELSKRDQNKINVTLDFWKKASEKGISKEQWKKYKKIKNFLNQCGFCVVFDGVGCPLYEYDYCHFYRRYCCNGNWDKWMIAKEDEDEYQMKKYAKKIYKMIEKYTGG